MEVVGLEGISERNDSSIIKKKKQTVTDDIVAETAS